jgi:PTH1 family peptidyl-tRNA hydrolase
LRLIVGLGNPGPRYARTRHNVGWQALDRAAARWSIEIEPSAHARRGKGRVGSAEVALAAPLAWMNRTGPVVKALIEEWALSPQDLIVIHDDLDLDLGRIRIRPSGGSGGHNGLLSIFAALNTDEFCRLKIGIGRPAPGQDPADYVLAPFTSEETSVISDALDQAALALECLVTEGVAAAMNRFNVRPKEAEENG